MRLPLFWWLQGQKYDNQPHGYVAPLYVTLYAILQRVKGRDAHWIPARKDTEPGSWRTPARMVVGHVECVPHTPRWLVIAECDFWNSRIGLELRKRGIG